MEKVKKFITNYEAALATHDWEQISPLAHNNCVATFSEGTYIGKRQVEAAFRKTFAFIKEEEYAIRDVHWLLIAEQLAPRMSISNLC